ncbi:MAG: hypothetical protein A2W98_03890 [Bacteroidetes bacterium GWF2_33_38]|nr:MAG: hypothetical protein A2W98_03890 [Bacteroidetes bacterium GWF2_33_38]OFY76197.1 MAG: hypothetical protein A2265_10715 [Bacteroidetes bacterium RIFOXYA12_FULL_33_9]OFY92102.1 MAG: hypothetical protein A2236_07585 [Bacteroidetes bacterium RIFOXYA2_FULL_33_7]
MENPNILEQLIERATEYGKTSYDLFKLRTLEKVTDIFSTIIPNLVLFILFSMFMLFINLGLAFWIGDLLGKIYFGFLAVAGFYFVLAFIIRFLMYKWLKKVVGNYAIKKILN